MAAPWGEEGEAVQAISTFGFIYWECRPAWRLGDTFQDDVALRMPNVQAIFSAGQSYFCKLSWKREQASA